jgi:hypothetical protein
MDPRIDESMRVAIFYQQLVAKIMSFVNYDIVIFVIKKKLMNGIVVSAPSLCVLSCN